ncbi:MAG TPA: hypothetical protein VF177_07825 [Anaerolineae bacterium]
MSTAHRLLPTFHSPWRIAAVLVLVLFFFISVGWWQATAVGPQVPVPMSYDAHYLFPRPWTQAQAAPDVPEAAPVALYGPNRISQPFTAAADRLAMVALWLAGPAGTVVDVTLSGEDGLVYGGRITLAEGEAGAYYRLTFPPVAQSRGRSFRLTLAAPQATGVRPVVTRTVGGDRLDGSIWLNEYSRPGNMALYTYSRGWPGRWWFDSLAEQVLPTLFRLRVQQYKPAGFKAPVFPLLLGLTVALSVVFLVLSHPSTRPLSEVIGWWSVALLAGMLVWQLGSGRLLLPGLAPAVPLAPAAEPLPPAPPVTDEPRLVNDMVLALWTAVREPEARFVTTDILAGYPAVRVPAQSALRYALTVPLNGLVRAGAAVDGQGELLFAVHFDDQEVAARPVTTANDVIWFELDLSPWQGQAGSLSFLTRPVRGRPDGLWLMPQLEATPEWLLAHPLPANMVVQPAGYRFGQTVELVAYEVKPASARPGDLIEVTLYWRVRIPAAAYATVFVHVLDENDAVIAQHDAQPVAGTYPLPNWQPGTIIVDRHTLALPADLESGDYVLAVGLYDPNTLARWPVAEPDGASRDDGRALLLTPLHVEAAP